MAFDDLSPMGDERGDLQAGIVASSLSNELRLLQAITRAAHGDKDARIDFTNPGDFMPLVHSGGHGGESRAASGSRSRSRSRDSAPTTRSQFDDFKSIVKSLGEGMKQGTVR